MNAKFLRAWTEEATTVASVTSLNGFNNPGPDITMGYAIRQGRGTTGRFIILNEVNLMGGPHAPPHTTDFELASAGAWMHFPKWPVLWGAGGNPWFSAHFPQGDGSPTGSEAPPGQRVHLAPGD